MKNLNRPRAMVGVVILKFWPNIKWGGCGWSGTTGDLGKQVSIVTVIRGERYRHLVTIAR